MRRRLSVSLDGMVGAGASSRLAARLAAAATLADLAGADRVRIGVREELAPVGAAELRDLRRSARQLELRVAPVPALVKCALEVRPEGVVLATESKAGHAPSPIDLGAWSVSLPGTLRTLREAGIEVTVAIPPTLEAVKAARGLDVPAVELGTGALVDLPMRERRDALSMLGDAARLAAKLRLPCGVGGGLDLAMLEEVLGAAPSLEWIAAGRGFAERALLSGVERAIRDWRERI